MTKDMMYYVFNITFDAKCNKKKSNVMFYVKV